MTPIVIPVKRAEDNPELRFTLRSIAANVPDPDVWVVGYRPTWLRDVTWLPNHTHGAKSDRGCQQTRVAANHDDIPDAFWWWDDDMLRLAPLDGVEHHHGGAVDEWLGSHYSDVESKYARVLRRTAQFQLDPGALFYDLHVPFWVDDKAALADTMHRLPDGRGGWLWRTVHGNARGYGGTRIDDVKMYRDDPIPDPLPPWLSSEDAAFGRLAGLLLDLFPTQSPWEGRDGPPALATAVYTKGGQTRVTRYRPSTDGVFLQTGWQRTALLETT